MDHGTDTDGRAAELVRRDIHNDVIKHKEGVALACIAAGAHGAIADNMVEVHRAEPTVKCGKKFRCFLHKARDVAHRTIILTI